MFYAIVYTGLIGQPVVCNLALDGKYEDHEITDRLDVAEECLKEFKKKAKKIHQEYRPDYRVVEVLIREINNS